NTVYGSRSRLRGGFNRLGRIRTTARTATSTEKGCHASCHAQRNQFSHFLFPLSVQEIHSFPQYAIDSPYSSSTPATHIPRLCPAFRQSPTPRGLRAAVGRAFCGGWR